MSFEKNEKTYYATLEPVSGSAADSRHVLHLMMDRYFYGRLRKTQEGWFFDNKWGWDDLAEQLGKKVESFYEST